jgi:integrase/recombinase XerD
MVSVFTAERAISPVDGSQAFVVVDQDYAMHAEASAYLAWLRSADRSPNTERVYAGRVALFLTYCASNRLDWRALSLDDLARFLRALVTVPRHTHSSSTSCAKAIYRSNGTANAIMTSVCEFLRFSATCGWVPMQFAQSLSHPKYLRYGPPGYDWGEDQQFRIVNGRAIRFREVEPAPESLTSDEIATVMRVLTHLRDRLLFALLVATGVRIGEALGLRREDMHLLSTSASLGCSVRGPHLHVRRRINANGALGKSREPRSIPVTPELVELYAEYQYERSNVADGDDCDFVFVNLYRPPVGAPLRYHNVKKLFERVSETVGFAVRPHMLRHSAASRWLAEGTPRDVVQALLGHVSPASMSRYFHPSDEAKRAAVERAHASHAGST